LLIQHTRIEQTFTSHVLGKVFCRFFELAVKRYLLLKMNVADFWRDIVISTFSARSSSVRFVQSWMRKLSER
jgi:hypothetical protein